jgi:serine protease Do
MESKRIVITRNRVGLVGIFVLALLWPHSKAWSEDPIERRRSLVVEVVEKVVPAVVNISTERIVGVSRPGSSLFWSPFDDLFFPFPGQTYYEKRQSLGSGAIVDTDGYVVTNAHVVRKASRIIITLRDGSEVEANLVGEDPSLDVAVLKLEKPGPYPAIPFGSSDDLMIGETVIVIGNPFGLQNTVTTGVLSALEREVTIGQVIFPGLIQTDAAINPGNSGGPLVNVNGELIGIAMAIQSGAEGIGFAIPARRARRVFEEHVYSRVSVEEFLGITVQDLTPGLAAYFGCAPDGGVVVSNIEPKSPAEKAGLHNGDLITTVDEKPVKNLPGFREVLDRHEGEEVSITYCREKGDKARTLRIKINLEPVTKQGEEVGPWMGLTVRSIDSLTARKQGFELDAGVVVAKVEPDSPAAEIGFRPGDLITDVGSLAINSIADFRKAEREYASSPPKVQVRVYRPGFGKPVVVVLERKQT